MHTHTKHINILSHLSLQCPCCITHHTHTLTVCDFQHFFYVSSVAHLSRSAQVFKIPLSFSLHHFLFLLHQMHPFHASIHLFFYLPTCFQYIFNLFSPSLPSGSSCHFLFVFFFTSCCQPLLTPAF